MVLSEKKKGSVLPSLFVLVVVVIIDPESNGRRVAASVSFHIPVAVAVNIVHHFG